MLIAVTGASGFIGARFVAAALRDGHRVRALVRPDHEPRLRGGDGLELHAGDLRDGELGAALLPGADALVHAALEHIPGRYRGGEGEDPAGFIAVNLLGSLHLIAAALAAGLPRVVVFSSRAVFDGLQVDYPATIPDRAARRPTTVYGGCKAALEQVVEIAAPAGADQTLLCGLRPTGVYGVADPVQASKWWDLVCGVADGHASDLSGGGTEVHVDDVAGAVLALLRAPAAAVAGRIFNCSDMYVSRRSIAELASRRLGVDPPAEALGPAPAPGNILDAAGLRALGVELRGRRGVDEVISELCRAVRER